jgi:hypothetical protein
LVVCGSFKRSLIKSCRAGSTAVRKAAVLLHPRCALVEDSYRQKPALALRTACSCVAWGETAGLSAKSMTLTFCCPGLDLLFARCPLVPVTNETS